MVLAVAAVTLAVLTALVTAVGRGPFAVDTALHDASFDLRTPLALGAAKALTATGTGVFPYVLAAAAGWIAGRRVRAVAAATAVLGLGQLVRIGLRLAVDRPRPPADGWAVVAHDASFPSGHATTSALAAGLLAWALLRTAPRAPGRAAAVCCGLWAAGVAATRVFLGIHWPSDIVAGWLLATCWLALTLPLLARFTHRRAVTADRPLGSEA